MSDTTTATPTFLYPEDNKVIAQSGSFALDFTLPEAALPDPVGHKAGILTAMLF